MRWTERQRAMLREMGINLRAPEVAAMPAENEVVVAPAASRRAEVGGDVARALQNRADRGAVAAPAASLRADAPATARPRRAEENATTARLPGLAPADWLVVAEPLDDSDPQQQQLLDNMLRAIGVALVAPDRERRAVFCALAAGKATAATRAADQAALQAAIATVTPRCLLAFGKAGAAALLGDDAPLGGLRGRVHIHAGVPVVVTFSLAFLLRHPAEKAKAWADLCLAVGSLAASAA
jgi:uracil-DNA glycosylase family 4